LYPSAYPQIRLESPLRTNQKLFPNMLLISVLFLFCIPLVSFSHTPRGMRTPG